MSQADLFGEVRADARLSPDGRYRYWLSRRWAAGGSTVHFVMLNPSTADALQDDPTIRRCIGFAKEWNRSALVVTNLYAYRATKPEELFIPWVDPLGPGDECDEWITEHSRSSDLTVVAWGAQAGPKKGRPADVLDLIADAGAEPHALALTKHGHPRHPLYVRGDAEPIPYTVPA